jgi:hypothetical protein
MDDKYAAAGGHDAFKGASASARAAAGLAAAAAAATAVADDVWPIIATANDMDATIEFGAAAKAQYKAICQHKVPGKRRVQPAGRGRLEVICSH